MLHPKRQMLIGGTLLVLGWIVTFAIMLEFLPAYIWLNMVAYAVTLVGFILGMIGVGSHIRLTMKHRDDDEYNDYRRR